MTKLKKYYAKYILGIIACIMLLVVQSQTQLTLPDYMSNIVTIGIQSGGNESTVYEVVDETTYQHLELFLNDEDTTLVNENYTFVENKDISDKIMSAYTEIGNQNIYILKDTISSTEFEQLSSALIKPELMVANIESGAMDDQMGNLPEGVDIYTALANMDDSVKAQMLSAVDKMVDNMGESTVQIAASKVVLDTYDVLGRDVNKIQNLYIMWAGLKMLGIALLSAIATILCSFFAAKVGAGVARDVRLDVFNKVESFSNEEFNRFSTASLITRTTNDVTQVQTITTMLLRIAFLAPIMGVGAVIKAVKFAPSMTWIVWMVLVILIVVIGITFAMVLPKFKKVQSLIDRLNLTMRENLSGMLVIRAFGNERHSEKRFDVANQDVTKLNLFVNRVMVILMPLMMFLFNVTTLVIVFYGAKQIDAGAITIGNMMAFMQYAMQILISFLMLGMIFVMVPRASVSAGRIYEVLTTPSVIVDPEVAKSFDPDQEGVVEFSHVSFRFPHAHEDVLKDISFKAKPGEVTAFIGSTGSGKTTLINMIPRLNEACEGEVKVNGVNVKEVNQFDLRETIGLVPQNALLFSGSIKENIKYGNEELSEEQLEKVISAAQAKEFVDEGEDGVDRVLSQGATNVSGGQKQRLSIARALAKKANIFVFDDSFSALDFKTDAKLRHELQLMMKERHSTVIMVGQRISSIMNADTIVVLDEGQIVGQGTHKELMETCKVYQEIAQSQLSKEELDHAK